VFGDNRRSPDSWRSQRPSSAASSADAKGSSVVLDGVMRSSSPAARYCILFLVPFLTAEHLGGSFDHDLAARNDQRPQLGLCAQAGDEFFPGFLRPQQSNGGQTLADGPI